MYIDRLLVRGGSAADRAGTCRNIFDGSSSLVILQFTTEGSRESLLFRGPKLTVRCAPGRGHSIVIHLGTDGRTVFQPGFGLALASCKHDDTFDTTRDPLLAGVARQVSKDRLAEQFDFARRCRLLTTVTKVPPDIWISHPQSRDNNNVPQNRSRKQPRQVRVGRKQLDSVWAYS